MGDLELNGNDQDENSFSNFVALSTIDHEQYEHLDISLPFIEDTEPVDQTTVSQMEVNSLNISADALSGPISTGTLYDNVIECEKLLEDFHPIQIEENTLRTTDSNLTEYDNPKPLYTDSERFFPAGQDLHELMDIYIAPFGNPEPMQDITAFETENKSFSFPDNAPAVLVTSNFTFRTPHLMEHHNLNHTKEKSFYCDICKQAFNNRCSKHGILNPSKESYHKTDSRHKNISRKEQFGNQYLTNTNEKHYECQRCKMRFSDQNIFMKHQVNCKSSVVDQKYKCDKCDKIFTRKQSLNIHYRIHTGVKPYECDKCDKRFSRKQNLDTHYRIHTGDKRYKCDKCNKRFSQKSHLKPHYRIHTGDKPYECDKCKKSFSRKSSLNAHYRIHTGHKPYECDKCKKRFSRKSYLNAHYKTHTGDKRYKCDKCNKRFSQKSHLNTHYRIHTGDKPYECKKCKKRFSDQSAFLKHEMICR